MLRAFNVTEFADVAKRHGGTRGGWPPGIDSARARSLNWDAGCRLVQIAGDFGNGGAPRAPFFFSYADLCKLM